MRAVRRDNSRFRSDDPLFGRYKSSNSNPFQLGYHRAPISAPPLQNISPETRTLSLDHRRPVCPNQPAIRPPTPTPPSPAAIGPANKREPQPRRVCAASPCPSKNRLSSSENSLASEMLHLEIESTPPGGVDSPSLRLLHRMRKVRAAPSLRMRCFAAKRQLAPPQVVGPTAGGWPHRRWLAVPQVVGRPKKERTVQIPSSNYYCPHIRH